jgi:hypothetical protein
MFLLVEIGSDTDPPIRESNQTPPYGVKANHPKTANPVSGYEFKRLPFFSVFASISEWLRSSEAGL